MTPAVSVIVTSYNYGRYLAGALDSVLAQTFQDFEIVIVDDGSTDDTPAVATSYLHDARIRYERCPHQGQPKTKNVGIRLARAPLLAFLDADDEWLPAKLERQVELFRRDPDLGVVSCRRLTIDADGNQLNVEERTMYRGNVLDQIFWRNFVCFSSCMIRRAALDEVGLFDEGIPLAIDYDLWLRMAARYRFDFVDEAFVKYRTGHPNLSRRRLERTLIARGIMARFLSRGGRKLVSPAMRRLAQAELACDIATELRETSWPQAVMEYGRAICYRPNHWPAWFNLATFWWPRRVKALARAALSRSERRMEHYNGRAGLSANGIPES